MAGSSATRRSVFGAAAVAAGFGATANAQGSSPLPDPSDRLASPAGQKAWSAITEPVRSGARTVLKVLWIGGQGPPPPGGFLGKDGSITPAQSEALDVSPMVERAAGQPGAVPRSLSSIAGEMWVTPEDFGASRRPFEEGGDDGPAIQAMFDWVRALTPEGSVRRAGMMAARLNPGGYYTRQALDFGGTGARYGFSLTGGGGQHQTTLYAQLNEPYPVLDCCNVATLRLSKFSVVSGPLCQSTAGILIARSTNAVFHNWGAVLEDVQVTSGSPNCVGAIICQDADLLDLVRTGANCQGGGAALILGNELPYLRHGQCRPGSGPSTLVLDAATPGEGAAYVGKRVKIFRGAGHGQVSTIISYEAATGTARVSPPWAIPPDGASQFYILALNSKFYPLGGDHTTTLLTASGRWGGSGFAGNPAIVWTGGDRLVLSDLYAAAIPSASKPPANAVIVVDAPTWPNTMTLECRGFRTENQVPKGPTISAINIVNGLMQRIDVNGELESGNGSNINNAIGVIRASGPGKILSVRWSGAMSYADLPLFNIDNDLASVEVALNFHNIGKMTAAFGKFDNTYDRDGLLDEVASSVRQGFYRGVAIVGKQSRLSGMRSAVSQILELQPFAPLKSTTTGGSAQKRLTWTIPADAMKPSTANVLSRFEGRFVGVSRAAATLAVQLSQPGRAPDPSALPRGPIGDGAAWRLEIEIMRSGSAWAWSWALWDGVTLRVQGAQALPPFDAALPLSLNILEASSASNALDVLTFSGKLC